VCEILPSLYTVNQRDENHGGFYAARGPERAVFIRYIGELMKIS
jgi:hypothetical protein